MMRIPYFLLLLASPLLLTQCEQKRSTTTVTPAGDVTFARKTFESLARGDSGVVSKIDWPVFTTQGTNMGANYTALASEVEKQQFTIGFVTQFATAFRESGGNLESFINWRVMVSDALKTEVAADSPNGVLTVTVSERDGVERVSSINVVK